MGTFDNLKQRATKATESAFIKAQQMSDISRLNSQIANEEKAIDEVYARIGRLYFSLHENNPEQPFADMVADVQKRKRQVSAYQNQMMEMKNARRCPVCGAEVGIDAAFCSNCGSPLNEAESSSAEAGKIVKEKRCKYCNAVLEPDAKFCTNCGKPIEEEKPEEPENKPRIEKDIVPENASADGESGSDFTD